MRPPRSMPEDAALLEHARRRIDALNATYGGDAFFLFHRPRRWNPGERVWMGFERKRGKLAELNWLLREADPANASERFSLVVGDVAALAGTRYVITLDTDTQLPRDAARQFVGTMAHPLNRPVLRRPARAVVRERLRDPAAAREPEPARNATARGTPACSAASRASTRTRARSPTSTRTCSTKARSSARASTTSTRSNGRSMARFPENRILSHDLLEGVLRAFGPAERRRAVRGLSRRRTRPTPRAGTAGSAATGRSPLAAAAGAGRRRAARTAIRCRPCRGGRSSTTCAAAWCRSRYCCCCWRAGRAARPWLAWTLAVVGICPGAAAARLRCWQLLHKPPEVPLRQHLDDDRAAGCGAIRAGGPRAGLPAVRGLRQRGRRCCARPGACWSRTAPAAGVEPVRRAGGATTRRTCWRPFGRCGSRRRSRSRPARTWLPRGRRSRWASRRRSCCCGWPRPASRGG